MQFLADSGGKITFDWRAEWDVSDVTVVFVILGILTSFNSDPDFYYYFEFEF